MAACSAQKPVPEPVSMHSPEWRLPAAVRRAHPTFPNRRSSDVMGVEHGLGVCDQLVTGHDSHPAQATDTLIVAPPGIGSVRNLIVIDRPNISDSGLAQH